MNAPSHSLKRMRTRALASLVLLVVVALAVWGFVAGRREATSEAEREKPAGARLQISERNGETVIMIDPEIQRQSGIEIAVAAPAVYPEQRKAYGTVLDLTRFNDLANAVANAKAQLEVARTKTVASRASYERAKRLFEDDRNVSAAQFQAAEAAFRADQAAEGAADTGLRTSVASAEQEFGPLLGPALLDGSPAVLQLLSRQSLLLQVTLPSGVILSSPPKVGTAILADGRRIELQLVSPAARTDPHIQGTSFFYTAIAGTGLLPGMSVVASLPTGQTITGAAVPRSAVVWLQGEAWIYAWTAPGNFVRHAIETDVPTIDGYVARKLPGDGRLVVTGAQSLLSEEFRSQIRSGEGGT